MYTVDIYDLVRREYKTNKKSIREIARLYNIDRKTVRRMVTTSSPPEYRLASGRPRHVMGPYLKVVRSLLKRRAGQAPGAKEIYDLLVAKHGFAGSYSAVRECVRTTKKELELRS